MFPSNGGCDGPFPVLRETAGNPTSSTHDHQPSLFLNFPETFLADYYDNEFLMTHFSSSQQQTMMNANGNNQLQQQAEEEPAEGEIKIASPVKATKKTTNKKKKNTKDGEKEVIPRKRTGKKDRHSKIYTAQGPRDRRMRLSLQIARKFFDLQDMLGFDKASKTIEWLFSKSRTAIKELTGSMPRVEHSHSGQSLKSLSSTSESEVVSGVKENESNKKKSRKPRSKVAINPVAKESRDKARARARERTKEKMKMRGAEKQKTEDPAEKLSSSVKEIDSASIIEKFLGMNTSTPQTFNYSQNVAEPGGAFSSQNDSVYPESWDRGYTRNDRSLNSYYYGEPGMKGSTGNNFQDQNPSAMFMLHPNTQEHRYSSSIFSNDREEHPNPVIMAPLNFLEHNPSSSLNPDTHFTENQFSCGGSFVAHKNCSFY